MSYFALWDLKLDKLARDPLASYGDGLCPRAVYETRELADAAFQRAKLQLMLVEVRVVDVVLKRGE